MLAILKKDNSTAYDKIGNVMQYASAALGLFVQCGSFD